MLKIAASIALVFVGGVVAAVVPSWASTSKTAKAAPASLHIQQFDERLEIASVKQSGHTAAVQAARVRLQRQQRLQRILAAQRAAAARAAALRAAEERQAAAERASRAAQRQALDVNSSAEAWAHSSFAVRVANCESGGGPSDTSRTYDGNPHLSDPNGHYGKWQFSLQTWQGVGGSGNPAEATEPEQDYRAWLLWQRDGWGQWECASMVG